MKDSPIYFKEERWEKVASELSDIKTLLQKVLDMLSNHGPDKEEVILNARDVAKSLAIDIGTVYAKCEKGEIPHFKIGNRYKFRQADISAWLEKGAAQTAIDINDYVDKYLQVKRLKG